MRRTERRSERREEQLICLLASFCSLLGVFFAVEEKRQGRQSRLGHFSVRSAALLAVFILWTLVFLAGSRLLSGVPILGLVTELALWIVYLAGVITLGGVRVSMMHAAWQELDYDLPVLEHFIQDHFHM